MDHSDQALFFTSSMLLRKALNSIEMVDFLLDKRAIKHVSMEIGRWNSTPVSFGTVIQHSWVNVNSRINRSLLLMAMSAPPTDKEMNLNWTEFLHIIKGFIQASGPMVCVTRQLPFRLKWMPADWVAHIIAIVNPTSNIYKAELHNTVEASHMRWKNQ